MFERPAAGDPLVARSSATYRPAAAVAALVVGRDVTCTFPGCRVAQRDPVPLGLAAPHNGTLSTAGSGCAAVGTAAPGSAGSPTLHDLAELRPRRRPRPSVPADEGPPF